MGAKTIPLKVAVPIFAILLVAVIALLVRTKPVPPTSEKTPAPAPKATAPPSEKASVQPPESTAAAPTKSPSEPTATRTVTPAAPYGVERRKAIQGWIRDLRSQPKVTSVVQKVTINRGSRTGVSVNVHLSPSSGIGKAATVDTGSEPVRIYGCLLAAQLYGTPPDPIKEADVMLYLKGHHVGTAAYSGDMGCIYLPSPNPF